MIQLNPQKYFTIVRGLENHSDPTTYYVRAFIRNSRTSELIETVDLVDIDGLRFTKEWQVPADPSGEGLVIDITTSVFTDTTYTTKAPNYGDKFDTYMIDERWNRAFGNGGGFTPDIDYKKIAKIIAESIKSIPKPEKVDFSPLIEGLNTIDKRIKGIKIPEMPEIKFPDTKEVDLLPLFNALGQTKADIQKTIVESRTQVDLNPIMKELGMMGKMKDMIKGKNRKLVHDNMRIEQLSHEIVANMKKIETQTQKPVEISLTERQMRRPFLKNTKRRPFLNI